MVRSFFVLFLLLRNIDLKLFNVIQFENVCCTRGSHTEFLAITKSVIGKMICLIVKDQNQSYDSKFGADKSSKPFFNLTFEI